MQNEMKRYAISYFFKGKKWCSDVYATHLKKHKKKSKQCPKQLLMVSFTVQYMFQSSKSRIARLLLKLLHKLANSIFHLGDDAL
ncbi:Uncharacterised protein [Avibacterium paragallinarum]|uniref:Uncharacterized protein n=1 Tax=Avibacterium paragallinarum TaxID=728 RepID=A0A380Z269_AVIPA|nr:Uncharacterised protein [Avibacterium paragallinarum]